MVSRATWMPWLTEPWMIFWRVTHLRQGPSHESLTEPLQEGPSRPLGRVRVVLGLVRFVVLRLDRPRPVVVARPDLDGHAARGTPWGSATRSIDGTRRGMPVDLQSPRERRRRRRSIFDSDGCRCRRRRPGGAPGRPRPGWARRRAAGAVAVVVVVVVAAAAAAAAAATAAVVAAVVVRAGTRPIGPALPRVHGL